MGTIGLSGALIALWQEAKRRRACMGRGALATGSGRATPGARSAVAAQSRLTRETVWEAARPPGGGRILGTARSVAVVRRVS